MGKNKKKEYLTKFSKYTRLNEKYYARELVFKDKQKRDLYFVKKYNLNSFDHYKKLEVCKQDAIAFSIYMLGIVPRPHQIYMLEQMMTKKRLAMCLGRRLGKSKVNQIFVLWAIVFNKFPSELAGTTFSIICQDLDTGKDLYIEELYMMIEDADNVIKENFDNKLGGNWFTGKLLTTKEKSGKVTGTQISLRSVEGKVCKIRALPPTHKARGKEGNIIGDEVSFWKKNNSCSNDIDFYDTVIHPILSDNPNYISIMSSTPDGYGDLWEKVFDPDDQHYTEYEKIWFPCWVYTPDWYWANMIKEEDKYAKRGEIWKFQQEYEARFVQMRNQYFDEEKHIKKFLDETHIFKVMNEGNELYMGLDFGGTMTSHTAIVITEQTEQGEGHVVFYKEYPVNEDGTLLADIRGLMRRFPKISKIVYDNKGGRYIEQQLKEEYGEYMLQPFNFTTDKQKGYSLLKQAMFENKIKAPEDKLLKNQLRNFTDKLKPMNKEISDDVLDAMMMAFYPILDKEVRIFNVIQY